MLYANMENTLSGEIRTESVYIFHEGLFNNFYNERLRAFFRGDPNALVWHVGAF
jgi:hypothetical protein